MKRLQAALDILFYNITKKDFDGVILITGDEGLGKSHLGLHIIDYWNNKLYHQLKEEDIKFISLDVGQFTETLKDVKRFEALVYDEAGDLSSKRTMSNLNVLITQAYQVIRGDNLLTILILPSPFDIDGFFTKRRARGLIHVTARGRMRYYSKNRLRKMIEINQHKIVKKVNIVPPSFVDTYPKYKGVLLEPYQKKKQDKMNNIRRNLYENMKSLQGKNPNDERNKLIHKMKDELGAEKTAELVGVSRRQIYNIIGSVKE